ncbi:hypothetical protein ADILRU_2026 [Leifsonia rubra CMS 76R]|nr:hypothetical protein ADILRU_2026 [Leifsonia rubra CMS 76R]
MGGFEDDDCRIPAASEKEEIMSDTENPTAAPNADGPEPHNIKDWTDLGKEMWSYLTGKSAVINYSFVDMTVEVPRDVGPNAPRATWKLNGTLRITTSEGAGTETPAP